MKITKRRLRKIIQEEVDPSQVVLVRGLGRMRIDQLRNNVLGKLEDLIDRANKGVYSTIGRTQFSVLEAMWNTLAEYEEQ
jgi:hypothetical protein